jgi:hypothetical protein
MTHAGACPFRKNDERSRPFEDLRGETSEPHPSATGSGTAR